MSMHSPAGHDRLVYLLNKTRARLVESIDSRLAQFDITAAQFTVLTMLAENASETAAQLCKENSYDRGAMTRMLDRLQHKNLISRVRSTSDRRVVKLELTDQGRKIYPALRAVSANAVDQILQGIECNEIQNAETLLEKILANKFTL